MTPKQTDFNGNAVELAPLSEDDELMMTRDERAFFDGSRFKPSEICGSCEETWLECYRDNKCRLEEARWSAKTKKIICFYCYESIRSRPNGTVIIFDPEAEQVSKYTVFDDADELYVAIPVVGSFKTDLEELDWQYEGEEELSPIQFGYVKSSAWRGRHEAINTDWEPLHEDGILGWSKDAELLKKFDSLVKHLLWHSGVKFAVIIGLTSNVFYQTYEMVTKGPIPAYTLELVKKIKLITRDPERYSLTAITGKSKDYTDTDRAILNAAVKLWRGEDMQTVIEDEIRRLRGDR